MAFDLSNTLVVGISATALFDMSESDQMFKDGLEADPASVIDKYRRYMQEREDEPLMPGITWSKPCWTLTGIEKALTNRRWSKSW